MRKTLTLAALLATSMVAHAAPFIVTDPWPASNGTFDSGSFTANGGAAVACALDATTQGLKCDVGSITAAGSYTLVLTWCAKAGIVNTAGGATVSPGGCVSSAPFAYRLVGAPATAPAALRVAP